MLKLHLKHFSKCHYKLVQSLRGVAKRYIGPYNFFKTSEISKQHKYYCMLLLHTAKKKT